MSSDFAEKLKKTIKKDLGSKLAISFDKYVARVFQYFLDNSFAELFLYDSGGLIKVVDTDAKLALSFKAYVDAGLPLKIVVSQQQADTLSNQNLPLIFKYRQKFNNENIQVKVSNDQFDNYMASSFGLGNSAILSDNYVTFNFNTVSKEGGVHAAYNRMQPILDVRLSRLPNLNLET